MISKISPVFEGALEALLPDPDLTVSQWADEHRILPEVIGEAGRWRTSRTPYLREIMDSLSPQSRLERVVFMKGAQIGGTECGLNWLGYIIHLCPGPVLMVQPTDKVAERVSKQKLGPTIDETPVLRERVARARSRDSGNTIDTKEFPGGLLALTGANSAVGLRALYIRYLFLDEIDAYPGDTDGEGDLVSLAKSAPRPSRAERYSWFRPKIKDVSRIERAYFRQTNADTSSPAPGGNYDWIAGQTSGG